MMTHDMPPARVMLEAFLERDASYDGVFFTGVDTTGIFCRTICPAKKPHPEHVRFFGSQRQALLAGFRPCKRCRPMEPSGTPPDWLRPLLDEIEADPSKRWSDADVRGVGVNPERVRRWFKRHHGMTFHAYSRARRLGAALGQVQEGSGVSRAAFEAGYESLSGFQEAFRRYFGSPPSSLGDAVVVAVDRVTTPLGPMLLAATNEALVLAEFVDRRALPAQIARVRERLGAVFVPERNALIDRAAVQLDEYFRGERRAFDVAMRPLGTEFQRSVWTALTQIPYGATRSYGEVATGLGRPAAVRAVGRANGQNALAILVPCHRVVGADGRLVGYGGGLWRKQRLLELETASL